MSPIGGGDINTERRGRGGRRKARPRPRPTGRRTGVFATSPGRQGFGRSPTARVRPQQVRPRRARPRPQPQRRPPVTPRGRARTVFGQSIGRQGRRLARDPGGARRAADRRKRALQNRYRPTFREPVVPLVAPGRVSPAHYRRVQRATTAAYARAGRRDPEVRRVIAKRAKVLGVRRGSAAYDTALANAYLRKLERTNAPFQYTLPQQVLRAQTDIQNRARGGRLGIGRTGQARGFGAGAAKYSGVSAFTNRLSSQLGATGPNARLLSVPIEAFRANIEGGPKTIGRTVRGLGEFALGAVPGVLQVGVDTVAGTLHGDPLRGGRKVVRAARDDYSRRYGPLVAGNVDAFRKRLRDEGTAAELVDTATVVAPEGAAIGRGLGAAARSGSLGRRAHRIASAPRPQLRVSGTAFREQELGRNFFRALGQRGEDALRARNVNRRNRNAAKRGAGRPGLQPFDVSPAVARHVDAHEHHLRELARAERNGDRTAARFHKARATQAARALNRQLVREERRRTPNSVVAASLWGQRRLQRIAGSEPQARSFNALKRQQREDVTLGVEQDLAALAKGRGGQTRLAASWFVLKGVVSLEHPEFAGRQLLRLRRRIEDEPDSVAVVAAIDAVLNEGPEKVFSHPAFREFHAKALERGLRLDDENPGVKASTAQAQRYRAQAVELGVEHPYERLRAEFEDGTHAERAKAAARLQREAEKELRDAERERQRAGKAEGPVRGRVQERVRVADLRSLRRDPKYRAAARRVAQARQDLGRARKAARNSSPGAVQRVERAELEHKRAQAAYRAAREAAESRLGRRPSGDLSTLERRRADVHAADQRVARAKAAVAEAKALRKESEAAGSKRARRDLERRKPELDEEFVRRVRLAAEHEGERLPDPVYVKDYPAMNEGREILGEYNVGGARAAPGVKQSRMSLYRRGDLDVSPQAYVRSTLEQIKRRHNWGLVADQVERAAVKVTPDDLAATLGRDEQLARLRDREAEKGWAPGTAERRFLEGTSLYDWHRFLYRQKLDPADYAFWNPGRARRQLDDVEGAPRDRARDDIEEPTAELERSVNEGMVEGLRPEAMEFQADRNPEVFYKARGWVLLPREAHNEITATAKGSGIGGRSVEKVMGLQSRILLGYNPTWPVAQVAANIFQSMFLIGPNVANPAFWVRAHKWFGSLPAETRRAIVDEWGAGIGTSHGRKTHIGFAANTSWVRALRAGRETATFRARMVKQRIPGLRRVPGNIADAMFAFDDVQNLTFRKGALYTLAKRDAYRQMAREGGQAFRLQQQIGDVLKVKDPRVRMKAILENPRMFERHAQHVDDFLGNWSRYTARERRTLKRFLLFYGFLRFSLRTAFYTLPVKHPIMLSIVAKLAQLHNEEVKELLGGDEAPWAYGRIFFGEGDKLSSIDLARINPVTNPLVSAVQQGPKALASPLFSPVVQATMDQLYSQSLFTGRGYRIGGATTESKNPGLGPRANIFAGDLLNTLWPYRVGEKVQQRGRTPADDYTLWNRKFVNYSSDEAVLRELDRRSRVGSWQSILVQQVLPFFVPRPDDTRATVQRIQLEEGGEGGGGGVEVVPSSVRVSGGGVPSGSVPRGAVPGSVKVSP